MDRYGWVWMGCSALWVLSRSQYDGAGVMVSEFLDSSLCSE